MLRNKHRSSRNKVYFIIGVLFLGFLGFCGIVNAQVQDVFDTKETQDVFLYKGDLVSIKVYQLQRIAIQNPGIVEIANADVDELLLVGQTIGQTALFIWDEFGKRKVMVRVLEEDLDLVITRIQKLLNSVKVEGIILEKNMLERKVIVKGRQSKQSEETLKKIFQDFSSYLIDLTVKDSDLIQIDVQISELSTTLQKALGIDWNTGVSGNLSFSYAETKPIFDGSIGDLFKIGDFERTTGILAIVNAMVAEGKARVLSKPSMVVANDEEVSFLVGGEIPVRTTTSSSGGTSIQETITYTSYGVDINVTPSLLGEEDRIKLLLQVTIRDIDASNAVGENVAFTTRTADTTLYLDNGQTIVLAGLIKQNKAETMTGVPFLRRIPILGIMFRNRNWPTNIDQEVVISVTPRIIRSKNIVKMNEEMKNKYKLSKQEEEIIPSTLAKDAEAGVSIKNEVSTANKEQPSQRSEETKSQEAQILPEKMPEKQSIKENKEEMVEKEASKEVFSAPEIPEKQTVGNKGTLFSGNQMEADQKKEEMELASANKSAVEIPQEIAGQDEKSNKITQDYVSSIQQRISQAVSFPLQAKEKGWQGTVTLSLTILSDGSLNDVKVKNSSGHDVFDKDAVNTAKILAPFDPFPAEIPLEQMVVDIPIVYTQEAVLEGTNQN